MSSPADKARRTPASLSPGDQFGRYQLLERIGKGGMAEVFRAVAHGVQGFERMFVVKRIRPDQSDSPKFVQMFCEEARISALLHHPNIVQVYDFGHIDGAYFMAMEHLDRQRSLDGHARDARAQRRDAAVAGGVRRARGRRALFTTPTRSRCPTGRRAAIVHRDVTPSNIMLLKAGGVKILDFGIAKAAALARRPTTANGKHRASPASSPYLSPELVRGAPSTTARTSSRSASCCGRWSRASACSLARTTARRCRTC